MMKRAQLISLFMLVLSLAVLLGSSPTGAQTQNIASVTGISVDEGHILTDLIGQTPINPCYRENPADPASPCNPMVLVSELWICDGPPTTIPPTPEYPQNCSKDNYSTLGFAYNCSVTIGGKKYWLYPGTCQ